MTIISPQVASYVTGVKVRDFQEVKAGDLLVQIDDRIYQQKLMQARAILATRQAALKNSEQSERSAQSGIRSSEAQIESAKAAYELANINVQRAERLAARGALAQSDVDQARATFAQAEAALHQAEAALDVARQTLQSVIVNRDSLEADIQNAEAAIELADIDLRDTRIVAPVDGRLGEIGVTVSASMSGRDPVGGDRSRTEMDHGQLQGDAGRRDGNRPVDHLHRRRARACAIVRRIVSVLSGPQARSSA